MNESTRNESTVTRASVARLNVQSMRYADARYSQLSARMDAIQVTLRRDRERTEVKRARCKLTDRMVYVVLAAVVAVTLDRATGIPHIAVIGIGALPECAREVYEYVRRV